MRWPRWPRRSPGEIAPSRSAVEPVQGGGVFGVAPSMSCTLLVPGTAGRRAGTASIQGFGVRRQGRDRRGLERARRDGRRDGAGGVGSELRSVNTRRRCAATMVAAPRVTDVSAHPATLGYRPLANAAEVSAAAAAGHRVAHYACGWGFAILQCSSQGPFDRLDSGPRLPAIQVVTFHRHSTANMKRRSPVALEYPPARFLAWEKERNMGSQSVLRHSASPG